MSPRTKRAPIVAILTDCAPVPGPGGGLRWPEHAYAHLCATGGGALVDTPVRFVLAEANQFRGGPGPAAGPGPVPVWTPQGDGGAWIRSPSPFPDAFYNRISRRAHERSEAGKRLIARLSSVRPFFNPRFVDKLETLTALAKAGLSQHLPPFRALSGTGGDAKEAFEFVRAHEDVYVKPAGGSLGTGVARIRRTRAPGAGKSAWTLQLNREPGAPPHFIELSDRELLAAISRWRARGEHLIQATVAKATWRGAPFDLRLLVHKSDGRRWRLTGVGGRAAGPSEITTHTLREGRVVPWEDLAGAVSLPTLEALGELAAKACAAVESSAGGTFYEFSLDVAVTDDGRAFILEVNSKPFPFDEPGIRARSARVLAECALRAIEAGPEGDAP